MRQLTVTITVLVELPPEVFNLDRMDISLKGAAMLSGALGPIPIEVHNSVAPYLLPATMTVRSETTDCAVTK